MFKHLSLTNYRNHRKFELDLSDITVLVGRNGVGKTNILESIGVVGYGRSFRGENRLDLVRFDADYARIIIDDLEVFIQKHPSAVFQVKEHGVKKKIADFVGLLPVVIFSPESLSIIIGEPKERRRFLDILISQQDHQYFRALLEYKKVIFQRNNLLKKISDGSAKVEELDFWDLELVRLAEIITKKRLEVVSEFSRQLSPLYQLISANDESELEINYHPKADSDFISKLRSRRAIDIAAGLTLSGPHRDDLVFKLNRLQADKFASRGELRSIVLALKMAELKYLENGGTLVENITNQSGLELVTAKKNQQIKNKAGKLILAEKDGKKPMLLLDDVFSEFDAERRSHLYKLIKNYQTLITTTDIEHLSSDLKSKSIIVLI